MKKIICIALCIISAAYSFWYASLGGFSGNDGALSKIGLEHPVLFAIWGILTFAALSANIITGYMKTKYKFYIFLLTIAFIGMMFTLIFDFDYKIMSDYYLHCGGSLTFSAVMGVTVFMLFLLPKRYVLTVITGIILFGDLMLLIVFKETAIIELAPIFSGYVMLCIHNFAERRTVELVK